MRTLLKDTNLQDQFDIKQVKIQNSKIHIQSTHIMLQVPLLPLASFCLSLLSLSYRNIYTQRWKYNIETNDFGVEH